MLGALVLQERVQLSSTDARGPELHFSHPSQSAAAWFTREACAALRTRPRAPARSVRLQACCGLGCDGLPVAGETDAALRAAGVGRKRAVRCVAAAPPPPAAHAPASPRRRGFNYAREHVGATRLAPACAAPSGAGYVVDHNRVCVGSGAADFAHAQGVLEKWGCVARPGPLSLADAPAAAGTSSWAGRL